MPKKKKTTKKAVAVVTAPLKRKRKSNAGRKYFDGKDVKVVVGQLEEAFAIGATVKEALLYAKISKDSYYYYIEKHKELSERFEDLRENPILRARMTVFKGIKDDPNLALKFLERRRPEEFAPSFKSEVKIKGEVKHSHRVDPAVIAIKEKYEEELRKRIEGMDVVDGVVEE